MASVAQQLVDDLAPSAPPMPDEERSAQEATTTTASAPPSTCAPSPLASAEETSAFECVTHTQDGATAPMPLLTRTHSPASGAMSVWSWPRSPW